MEKVRGMSGWMLEAQCTGGFWRDEIPCGDTFQVTEEDLKVQRVLVNFDLPFEVIGFVCPACGTFTEIHMDKIPVVIKNRVLAKYRAEKRAKRRKGFKDLMARFFK